MWVRGKWTSKSARRWRQAAHWLDRQPLPRVIAVGAVLGLGLGLPGFFYLRSPAWMLLWGALFVALWCLGRDAEPVYEHDTPVSTTPKRVEDGPFTMMHLPAGDFYMGSPDNDDMAQDNENPQHLVTVSGFRMAVTPVTAELYHEIMQGEAPSEGREQTPAENVSWFDAVEFCNRLSKREGYRRCYYRLFGRWFCYWRADGYRLPTEAEWEYACRAGTKTRYSFGDDSDRLDRYTWFRGRAAHEVAQKLPNPWGLYDMHGNVWEWCWDWIGPYTNEAATDPRGPKKPDLNQPYRVVRGGSFDDPPEVLRSAARFGFPPEVLRSAHRFIDLPEFWVELYGFRCVRVPRLID